MFEDWHDFYLLIGGASGALIGLLFVVATLAPRMEQDRQQQGTEVYTTPTVFHLAVVLAISGLAMFPALSVRVVAVCVAGGAVSGVAYGVWIIAKMARGRAVQPPHWSDVWFYGVLAVALYLLLAATGACIWLRRSFGADMLALTTLALIGMAIRNAWDLVTWIAPRVEHPE